jgi:hypothetical protein
MAMSSNNCSAVGGLNPFTTGQDQNCGVEIMAKTRWAGSSAKNVPPFAQGSHMGLLDDKLVKEVTPAFRCPWRTRGDFYVCEN